MHWQTQKKTSAPGEDDIDYFTIDKTNTDFRKILADLYTKVWNTGKIPTKWKMSVVILLDKPGKDALRPIALTNCVGKIMEKIVNYRLVDWAEKNNIMHEWQNGFRKNRSTLDNLVKLTTDFNNNLAKRRSTPAVFLDAESESPEECNHPSEVQ